MKYDIDGHLWWAPMKKPGGGWIAFKDGSANPSAPSSASSLGSKQTASLGQLQSQLQGTGVGAGASPNPLAQSSQVSMNNPANGVSGGYTGGGNPQPAMATPGFQMETPGMMGGGYLAPTPYGSTPATNAQMASGWTAPSYMSGAPSGPQPMLPGAAPAGGIVGPTQRMGLAPSYGSGSMGTPGGMSRQLPPAGSYGGFPMGGPMGNPALGPDRMPTTVGAQPGQMQAMVNALRNMPASTAAQGPQVLPPNVQPRSPQLMPMSQAGRGGSLRNGMQ